MTGYRDGFRDAIYNVEPIHRLCHQHGGEFPPGERIPEGTKFWCPAGRECWVYMSRPANHAFYKPLTYGKVTV